VNIDIEHDADARRYSSASTPQRRHPVVVCRGASCEDPSNADVAQCLGMNAPAAMIGARL